MGFYLMAPGISNPEGHYEDLPLVSLHDRLLCLSGIDWRLHDEREFDTGVRLDILKSYIYGRSASKTGLWGAKDPRTCLFLSEWRKILGERGCYLVLLRHWSGSIQSLYRRHSESISLSEGANEVDGGFWFNPLLAADMWLAYNRRILEFLQSCPKQQRLVATQQAVLSGLNVPVLVNQAFDLGLDESVPSPIKTSLVHDQIEQSVRDRLPESKFREMDELWEALLAFADYRAEEESPQWVPDADVKGDALSVYQELLSAADQAEPIPGLGPVPEALDDLLVYARENPLQPLCVEELTQRVEQEAPYDAQVWEKLAMALKVRGHADKAEKALVRVLLAGKSQPYIYMLLGTCREAEFEYEGAEHFYQLALARNPANPVFHVRLAYLYLVLARYDEAETLLRKGIEEGNHKPLMFHALANVLDQRDKTAEAVELLEAQPDRPELLEKQRMTLLMKLDYASGKELYQQWARERAQSPEVRAQVVKTLATVSDPIARKDLARRVVLAWQ
ncbi:tetratricopeptide repeat protein [Marinobacter sp. GN3S48]|uniref:tetratricopeptide repeat protein n=1 Tax=Marinobacter sp. GN3S48 TaxID=3382302 RepID=UPI00387B7772